MEEIRAIEKNKPEKKERESQESRWRESGICTGEMTIEQRFKVTKVCSGREGVLEERQGGQHAGTEPVRRCGRTGKDPDQVGPREDGIFTLNEMGSHWRLLSRRVA